MKSFSDYLQQLKSSDPAQRRQAIRHLAAFQDEKTVTDAIANTLGDPNKGVQNIAIEILSQMPSECTVQSLIAVVKSTDLNIRNAGMSALRNIGPLAVSSLLKSLKSATDVDEIIQILVVLGDIGSPLATKSVVEFIKHEDGNVQTTAIESLGKIQDPSIIDNLIDIYQTSEILKYSIVEALGNISVESALPTILNALESEDILEYFTSIGALGSLESPKGAQPLFDRLIKEDDAGTRRLIIKSLEKIETAAPGTIHTLDATTLKPIIQELISDEDSAEYGAIVKLAASLKSDDFIDCLLKALRCKEPEISQTAFEGLVALGQKSVKPALNIITEVEPIVATKLLKLLQMFPSTEIATIINPLSQSENDHLRQCLATTLGLNPSDSSFSALKGLLSDPDEVVRKNSVKSISRMLDYDGALTVLIEKLNDMNGHVRREAALAMKSSSSAQVVEPLFKVISKEPYGDVREAAATVLAARKEPEITRRLLDLLDSENSRIRETVSKTIWQCGSTLAVDSLINRLSDKEWRVIVNSCKSLEKMKDLKSIFPLKELLKNNDWQIRIAALSALRAFGSKELKQFFLPLLTDENTRVAKLAVVSLSELCDKSLDEDLKKHINHPKWEVRYQIVKALGNLNSQSSIVDLIEIVNNDTSNAVKSRAILSLAKMGAKQASQAVLSVLDNEDKNLVVTAIKYFVEVQDLSQEDLSDKIKNIFLHDLWVRDYFIKTFAQNNSKFLESILKSVVSPKQARKVDNIKNAIIEKQEMSIEEALIISDLISDKCGLEFEDFKALEANLSKNLDRFFITSWIEYYHFLRYGSAEVEDMLKALFDSITDPSTEFFDEQEQMQVLTNTIIPEVLAAKQENKTQELNILSIGSSFGPEPYSIAMSILEEVHPDSAQIKVTGVDISQICLNTAKRGIYKSEIFRAVDQKFIDLYFEDDRGDLRVSDEIKNVVDFKFANAVDEQIMESLGEYDIVICRNLLSAFSQRGKERLTENIYNILAPGGIMLIAGSETLYNVTKAFKLQTHEKVVAYRKL